MDVQTCGYVCTKKVFYARTHIFKGSSAPKCTKIAAPYVCAHACTLKVCEHPLDWILVSTISLQIYWSINKTFFMTSFGTFHSFSFRIECHISLYHFVYQLWFLSMSMTQEAFFTELNTTVFLKNKRMIGTRVKGYVLFISFYNCDIGNQGRTKWRNCRLIPKTPDYQLGWAV
jgi:hypothetical protein